MWLNHFVRKTWSSYVEFHTRAPFKHSYLAWIGLVTFPLYYLLWTFILPQPYENLPARLGGMALCIAYLLRDHWPRAARRWKLPFMYVAVMLCLPFFFTYMLLKNDASTPWLMSTMTALVFVVLVYDATNVFIVTILGSLLAIGLFLATEGHEQFPSEYLLCLPVLSFALIAVMFLAHTERSIAQEKLQAAKLLASNIAHEMRTPLLGIRMNCERLQSDLATSNPTGALQEAQGEMITLSGDDAKQLRRAIARISEHAIGANQVIDILLANVQQSRRNADDLTIQSYREVIVASLDRFHFRPKERDLVAVSGDLDEFFRGSRILMTHVIFNLLRNALKAIETKGCGTISIEVRKVGDINMLTVADTGCGIEPELMPLIFMPFVTGGSRMQGTGIGLAFVKPVIESFGGTITCRSVQGVGTTFDIALPRISLADGRQHMLIPAAST